MAINQQTFRRFSRNVGRGARTRALILSILVLGTISRGVEARQQESPNGSQAAKAVSPKDSATLPRGKKLMLKDGSFQLVREYKVEGDRVRYYSLDRSQWEEIPVALIDWDGTKKIEAEQERHDAAFVDKVHAQEEARRAQPIDIDASLEAAPGVFLPPGQGMFVFDDKAVLPVPPAEPNYKTDKKRAVEKVLSPIPIVPSRRSVLLDGAHAKLRIKTGQPEFYMRLAQSDTTRPSDPELELVPARVRGATRQIANVDQLFKMEEASTNPLLMQRWQIANGVYRFTLGQTLSPGEYALIEVVAGRTDLEQLSIYVWDFGVDAGPPAPLKAQ